MIGSTVGHYKVLEKLGEGGMGVVYKAQDLTLDRQVALKFLPAHVSASDETKARFLQEAKAAAALNHANICTIHGVDEAGGTMFIVMEYVDGGTLRSKIPYASVDEAATIAAQIAEALQEAHVKGIVHRDIKADNIMLTAKGQAKVMDFGLAKLKGSLKLTRTSSTVGTLAYMAPEQIQGGSVDTRSDIFSFGVLLFEMLTGKTPFRGEHEAAMLYSIVNEEPQGIEASRQDVSPLLAALIARCLEKDPADRFQHMDDIVSELRRAMKKTSKVMRSSASMPVTPATGSAPSGVHPSAEMPSGSVGTAPRPRVWVLGGSVAAVAFIALAAWWFMFRATGVSVNPSMTTRVLQVPFTQFSYPSLSPDGKWIAFPAADANGKWDIYYMHVNGGEPRKITSDATFFIQQSASISPDGSQVAYDKANDDHTSHDLHVISSLGGTSRKLAERVSIPSWSPDGKRIGFIRTPSGDAHIRSDSKYMEFWTVGGDGQGLRREFMDSAFVTTGDYRFSYCWGPDGRSIVWIRSFSTTSQVLIVKDLSSGDERQLTQGDENIDAMQWTVNDRIIFSSNRGGNTNLWAIPASGGTAVQVTKGGGPDLGVSVSASGNELVYLQQQPVSYLWTSRADGSGLKQITFDDRELAHPAYSPDKKRIAFAMSDPDPLTRQTDLYVVNADGNNRQRLTTGNFSTMFPVWSPDGRRILYTSQPSSIGADTGAPKVYVVDVDNPGTPKLAGRQFAWVWLDDDHFISVTNLDSYINEISTGTTKRFYADSVKFWSGWDGKHFAIHDRRRATAGWWVVELATFNASELMASTETTVKPPQRGSARKINSNPGPLSRWVPHITRSGMALQIVQEGQLRQVSFVTGQEKVLPAHFPGLGTPFDVSNDGNDIVYVTPRLSSRLVLLEHVFD